MRRYKYLNGYTFTSCFVRSPEILYFPAQEIEYSDPLETWPSGFFVYYTDKPAERAWGYVHHCETGEIYGCAPLVPEARGVFVNGDGSTYVVGGGHQGWEEPVTPERSYFKAVRCVQQGKAHAVRYTDSAVFRRDQPSEWTRLPAGVDGDAKLVDIDGFGDDALYACGEAGHLWRFDGSGWTRIQVPTDRNLKRVLCCSDGRVVVTCEGGAILVGEGRQWTRIDQAITPWLGDVVEWSGRVLLLAEAVVYELRAGGLHPADLGEPTMKTKGYMDARDDVLLLAGQQEFAYYAEGEWHQPLKAPRRELLWR